MDKNTYRKFLMAKIDVAQREIEVTKELVAMLDEGTVTSAEETQAAPVEPKKAKASKAKPETKQEAPEKIETESETSLDDDFMNDDADISAPTVDDVRKAIKDFAAKHGKQKTEKLLSKFNAQAIPQIKEKDFTKVIELVNKYL